MRAIDVHVHPSTRGLDTHACNYFRRDLSDVPQTPEGFAGLYEQHDVKALLIGWHPSTVHEGARNTNDHVLDLAANYPKSFAGVLASLDTNAQDLNAVARYAEALVGNPKVVGFKFHPPDQGFYPSDKKYYGIWKVSQAGGKPVMFHIGFTVLGANTDGGSGIGLDYGRPIHLDTLAKDFPRMKILAAHPGWPWVEETIGVVTHKKNIFRRYFRLSGRTIAGAFSKGDRQPAARQSAFRHGFSLRRSGQGAGELRQDGFQRCREREIVNSQCHAFV